MTTYINSLPDAENALVLLDSICAQSIPSPVRKVDKPLILYGAGNLGRMAKTYFDRIGIKVDAVVDRQAEKHKQDVFWLGVKLVHPNDITENIKAQKLLVICVSNIWYTELAQEQRNIGWIDIVHFYDVAEAYRELHPLSNGWFCDSISEQEQQSILKVLQRWEDDLSRAYHIQFIAWRHLRQDWLFSGADMMVDNRYLIPEVTRVLTDHEFFVDVGAHQGETSLRLLEAVNFNFKQLIIFEADENNLQTLKQTLAPVIKTYHTQLQMCQQAVVGTNADENLFYDGAGYASQLASIGTKTVQTITLDELGFPATFIKLHIEGGELEALKGAKHTLLEHRPIILVTVYHNRLGLADMADWIMSTMQDYKFYYRLHSGCGTGAVMYAIPSEREETA